MSKEIVINGRSVASLDVQKDASRSDYILIRTKGFPLNKAQKKLLTDLHVKIQEFVGSETEQIYLCGYEPTSLDQIRGLEFIDYANVYAPIFAVPSDLRTASAQVQDDEKIEVDILLHHDVEEVSAALLKTVADKAGLDVEALTVDNGFIRATVNASRLDDIGGVDEVRVVHPVTQRQVFNNMARQILHANDAVGNGLLYTGKGQLVCVADTGFDNGDINNVPDAFAGRVYGMYPWGRKDDQRADDPDGHGTHVCGSVLASGQHKSQGLIQGGAPAATLMVQSVFSGFDALGGTALGGIPEDLGTLFDQAYDASARIHTNSWGTGLPASGEQVPYNNSSERIDKYIWEHQDMTILFAAGNDGQDKDSDGKFDGQINERSLGAEAASKNCITVGATENKRPDLKSGNDWIPYTYGGYFRGRFTANPLKDDHLANNPEGLAAFSSRGPTKENRLKPDVVAPGTAILSTRSRSKKYLSSIKKAGDSGDDRYMYLSGTSMATPLVAGCCAVLREMLLQNGYRDIENGHQNPTGALIKALLINGAVPINGQYMPDEISDNPNPHSGFGRVNVQNSIMHPDDQMCGYGTGTILEEDEAAVTVEIPIPRANRHANGGSAAEAQGLTFKVTMTYADLPGGALSNDLNLVVVAGDKERHGNQPGQDFNVDIREGFLSSLGALPSYDRSNNTEQIVWHDIPGDQLQLIIKPFRLMAERVPFAYAWRFF